MAEPRIEFAARSQVTACGKKGHVTLPKRYVGRPCYIIIADRSFDMLIEAVQGFGKIVEYLQRDSKRDEPPREARNLKDLLELDADLAHQQNHEAKKAGK